LFDDCLAHVYRVTGYDIGTLALDWWVIVTFGTAKHITNTGTGNQK